MMTHPHPDDLGERGVEPRGAPGQLLQHLAQPVSAELGLEVEVITN